MFFSSNKSTPSAPKQKSTLGVVGSLFNPNVGATLRPLAETGKMLTTIVALLFAAHGLFPRNHPALLNVPGARITLAEVIGTAFRNLKFNPQKPLPVLVFVAVIASLFCSALAIIAGLMKLFVGTAHAQAPALGPGMFVSPAGSSDVACGWINFLFNTTAGGCNLNTYLQNGQIASNLQSAGIQTALLDAFAYYSDVILVIAAVVLFYHLTAMIVETAHHGVAMGRRANQVWAPIRLVVAVGLLVPINSSLNAGQYIVLQIAQWGSAIASVAWGDVFLNALYANSQSSQLAPPITPSGRRLVSDMLLMEACATAYNQIVNPPNNQNNNTTPPAAIPIPATCAEASADGSTKCSYQPTGTTDGSTYSDLCGYYIIPPPVQATGVDNTLADAIRTAGLNAFNSFVPQIPAFFQGNLNIFISGAYGGNESQGLPQITEPAGGFENLVGQYEGFLYQNLQGVNSFLSVAMAAVKQTASQEGWVAAGAWFNTVARLQGDISDLSHDTILKTSPPQVQDILDADKKAAGGGNLATLADVMKKYQDWLSIEVNPNINGNGLPAEQQQMQLAEAGIVQDSGSQKQHVMDLIFEAVDIIAARDGVWSPAVTACGSGPALANGNPNPACFTLGVQFQSYDPLAEIAAFGHSNINTAYDLFDDYLVLMGAVSGLKDLAIATGAGAAKRYSIHNILLKVFGATAGATAEAGGAIGDVVGMIVVVFFTAGFMLAFFLPLIPFYRFTFGTLSWFLSLLEAVVAVPLVALAHLTPEGEGFMGDKAKTAYYFIFNLFLRPILMVFGLIAGFLLFDIAASLMNLLYTTAVAGAGGVSNGHYTLARIVYSMIYVVILYLLCNKCFQLIDWLPEHAIKWMGAQGLHHATMGDPTEVGGYMGLASAAVEQKIVAGAGAFMRTPGGVAALAEMAHNPRTSGAIGGAISRMHQFAPGISLPAIEGAGNDAALTSSQAHAGVAAIVAEKMDQMQAADPNHQAPQLTQEQKADMHHQAEEEYVQEHPITKRFFPDLQ